MSDMPLFVGPGAPVFENCTTDVQALLGAKNVQLSCVFFSKPEWKIVQWQGIKTPINITMVSTAPTTQAGAFMAYTKVMGPL